VEESIEGTGLTMPKKRKEGKAALIEEFGSKSYWKDAKNSQPTNFETRLTKLPSYGIRELTSELLIYCKGSVNVSRKFSVIESRRLLVPTI
jgi:hypothetical protein